MLETAAIPDDDEIDWGLASDVKLWKLEIRIVVAEALVFDFCVNPTLEVRVSVLNFEALVLVDFALVDLWTTAPLEDWFVIVLSAPELLMLSCDLWEVECLVIDLAVDSRPRWEDIATVLFIIRVAASVHSPE